MCETNHLERSFWHWEQSTSRLLLAHGWVYCLRRCARESHCTLPHSTTQFPLEHVIYTAHVSRHFARHLYGICGVAAVQARRCAAPAFPVPGPGQVRSASQMGGFYGVAPGVLAQGTWGSMTPVTADNPS